LLFPFSSLRRLFRHKHPDSSAVAPAARTSGGELNKLVKK
jgi:hypothetical protein